MALLLSSSSWLAVAWSVAVNAIGGGEAKSMEGCETASDGRRDDEDEAAPNEGAGGGVGRCGVVFAAEGVASCWCSAMINVAAPRAGGATGWAGEADDETAVRAISVNDRRRTEPLERPRFVVRGLLGAVVTVEAKPLADGDVSPPRRAAISAA